MSDFIYFSFLVLRRNARCTIWFKYPVLILENDPKKNHRLKRWSIRLTTL